VEMDINKGLSDKRERFIVIISALTITAILSGAIGHAFGVFNIIAVKSDILQTIPDLIMRYALMMAAVERSAAVFVGMYRNQGKVDWSLRINRITETMAREESADIFARVCFRESKLIDELVASGKSMSIPYNAEMFNDVGYCRGFLASVKHAYEFQRARFNSISSRYISNIVYIAGIILAATGLSIFGDVLTIPDTGAQMIVIRLCDIIITGGLLGGGSTGLNVLANKVGEKIT
jgi:hypothetical protein